MEYMDRSIGFGKYRDIPLRDVPDEYIKWMMQQKKCPGYIRGEWSRRKKIKKTEGVKKLKKDKAKFYQRKTHNSSLREQRRMSFGKYRGTLISEIPDSYLEWVLKLGERNTDAKYLMDEFIYRLENKNSKE